MNSSANRPRILIIDDDEAVAETLQLLLSRDNEIAVATDGKTGLTKILTDPYDVIFCDVSMPGFSGMDLYNELQAANARLLEKLIFMTGGTANERIVEFLEGVPNIKVDKPFTLKSIREVIQGFLARSPESR